ncbi:hypothetical protein Tco_0749929 [Tanacetum coccineum]|uniref:Uncharacterized protein n=1 Tax=Tanacetum coccineum TaxID=301880 RepID=A0ABQ4Z307_9ASTR
MQNREHGRLILELVEHGPLIWPTVEENEVIRTKKYAELSAAKKIQADCDMKATNIILQGLPADIYSLQEIECKLYDAFDKFTHIKGESLHTYYLRFTQLINDMDIYKMKMEQFQVNTKFLNSLLPEWSKFVTDVKLFRIHVFSPGDDPIACLNKAMAFLTTVASSREMLLVKEKYCKCTGRVVKILHLPREVDKILDEEQLAFLTDTGIPSDQAQTIILHNAAFQTEDLYTYDSDCDDLLTAQAVLMTNISNYGSDVISENNESITAELERYKERVKTFEQRLNIDLSSREKMIDSQMDDMIKEKLALKEQVDSLEQNLSKQIKEKESLLQTFAVFKNESKEKENKYMENEIDLEKKIKELDNIICKAVLDLYSISVDNMLDHIESSIRRLPQCSLMMTIVEGVAFVIVITKSITLEFVLAEVYR